MGILYDLDTLTEKVNIVEYVSQYVQLQFANKEYWGICPIHKEDTPSFSVDENKQRYYCQGCKSGGNVLNFIMDYHKKSLSEAIEILCKYLSIEGNNIPIQSSLTTILKKWNKIEDSGEVVVQKRLYLRESVMEQYRQADITEWIEEGISQEIMNKYEVRYDDYGKRIVFPIRDSTGKIISISGRTIEPDWKEKKLRKYTYYQSIKPLDFLYGYCQSKISIEDKNEIIIFEGAKSKWKAEIFGYENSVASMTSSLSEEQIKLLISTNVRDVVIAWDKGVDMVHIRKNLNTLKHFKNIYIIQDTGQLLEMKDSPVDKGQEIWKKLYENRILLK